MNTCIYSKRNDNTATFVKQEHILPASLGGSTKLPNGYVSDEINLMFSRELELGFTRESILSIFRQFVGPGHRGNVNNINKASQSKVSIITNENGDISLGYIALGVPYQLNQISISLDDTGTIIDPCTIAFNPGTDIKSKLEKLIDIGKSLTIIKNSIIPNNKVILAMHEYQEKGKGPIKTKWYLAHNGSIVFNEDFKSNLVTYLQEVHSRVDNSTPVREVSSGQIAMHQEFAWDIYKFYRCCAKIAFNYLAHLLGPDIMLESKFDDIRNYIVHGGSNLFVEFPFENIPINNNILDEYEEHHLVFASFSSNKITVYLLLYNSVSARITIPHGIPIQYLPSGITLHGVVFDWKNRRELDFVKCVVKDADTNPYLHKALSKFD